MEDSGKLTRDAELAFVQSVLLMVKPDDKGSVVDRALTCAAGTFIDAMIEERKKQELPPEVIAWGQKFEALARNE